MRKDPSFFSTITIGLTHSVGSSTLVIIWFSSMRVNSSFSRDSRAIGTFLGAVILGLASSCSVILCVPGRQPTPVKRSSNLLIICSGVALLVDSCCTDVAAWCVSVAVLLIKSSNLHDLRPKTGLASMS